MAFLILNIDSSYNSNPCFGGTDRCSTLVMGTAKQVILRFHMHERKNNCFYPLTVRELLAYSRSLSELMLYTTLLFLHVYRCSLVCRPSCMCIHVEAKS